MLNKHTCVTAILRDREVACSASDRSNFESCVWRAVSSHSSHHPQEVLLAQFSLYVHKSGLKPDSFHFICNSNGYRPSLSTHSYTSLTGQKSKIITRCWFIVGAALQMMAQSLLNLYWINLLCLLKKRCAFIVCAITSYKTLKLRGSFRKVLFKRYCNMKALQLYLSWSVKPLFSPVVLKLLQTRRIIEVKC